MGKKGFKSSHYSIKRFSLYNLNDLNSWRRDNIDEKKSRAGSKNPHASKASEPRGIGEFDHLEDKDVPKHELERRNEYEKLVKAKKNNDILNEQYVSVDDIDKTMATLAGMLIASLTNFEKSAPTMLANKEQHEIVPILEDAHQNMMDKLSSLVAKEFKCDETLYDIINIALDKIHEGVEPSKIVKKIGKI